MTPTQRAAAERLIGYSTQFCATNAERECAALLRELLAEPQGKPVARIQTWWKPSHDGTLECHAELTDFEDCIGQLPTGEHLLYAHPLRRQPLTPSLMAEVEGDCLTAWNASTYGHSALDTVHPMFLSAFVRGYRAAERAHGIGEAP